MDYIWNSFRPTPTTLDLSASPGFDKKKRRSPPPKSGSPKRGFRRLNSMEDPIGASMQHSPTWPGDRNSSEPMSRQYNQIHDMQKTEAETKWFGSYGEEDHLQPSHPHHQDVRHYHPAAMDSWTKYQTQPKRPSLPHSRSFSAGASSPAEISFQRPFNVNKRRYEDFPMLVEGGHMSPLLNQHLHYNNQPNHQVAARQMASSLPTVSASLCNIFGQVVSFATSILPAYHRGAMEDPQTTEPPQQATSPPPAPHSSALNPDAQVFVPALNPNARAFYPRQSMLPPASSDMDFLAATKAPPTAPSSRDSGCGSLSQANSGEDTPPSKPSTPTPPENGDLCVTPIMEDEDLKAIGERKQTPWVDGAKSAGAAAVTTTTVGNPSDVHQRVEKEETEEKGDLLYPLRACSVEGRRRRRKSSASSDEEQEAEQSEVEDLLSPLVVCSLEGRRRKRRSASSEDDEQSEEEENEEEDNTAAGHYRLRTDSTCSNSSDGIEFSTESPPKQFQLASFCSGSGYSSKSDRESDESDSESDSDDDDDDGEWDELDGDELATIPEELQNCGLTCQMLGNFTQPICVPEPPTAAPTSPSCDSDPAATGGLLAVERHPLKNDAFSEDREAMKRTLRKHNEIWGAMESPVVSSNVQLSDDDDQTETFNNSACDRKNNTNNIKKWVQFSSPEHWDSWYEHPDEVAVLRESRKNDMLQRRADKERMERLIRPIMTKEHREKIFQKLYGAVDKEEETSLKID